MAVAYVLYEITGYGIYISKYHGWFLFASVISLTYLCQNANRQICEYHTVLSPEFWTGDDEHLRRISGFTINSQAIHTIQSESYQATKAANRANDQTNTFNYNC